MSRSRLFNYLDSADRNERWSNDNVTRSTNGFNMARREKCARVWWAASKWRDDADDRMFVIYFFFRRQKSVTRTRVSQPCFAIAQLRYSVLKTVDRKEKQKRKNRKLPTITRDETRVGTSLPRRARPWARRKRVYTRAYNTVSRRDGRARANKAEIRLRDRLRKMNANIDREKIENRRAADDCGVINSITIVSRTRPVRR